MKPTVTYSVDGLEVSLVLRTPGVHVHIQGSTRIPCTEEEGKDHEVQIDVSLTVSHKSTPTMLGLVDDLVQGQYPNAADRGQQAATKLLDQVLDLTDVCSQLKE